MGINFISL